MIIDAAPSTALRSTEASFATLQQQAHDPLLRRIFLEFV